MVVTGWDIRDKFEREIQKVGGLYVPTDVVRVDIPDSTITYRSNRFSDKPLDGYYYGYNDTTQITFDYDLYSLPGRCSMFCRPSLGWIRYLSVKEDVRGKRFGRGMVEAVERTLGAFGVEDIYIILGSGLNEKQDRNNNFWNHLGYNLSELWYKGLHDKVLQKSIRYLIDYKKWAKQGCRIDHNGL